MDKDFVSGENFSTICDVSIYERKYLKIFPNLLRASKKVIYYNEEITKEVKEIIKNSKIFFVKTDYVKYFEKKIMPLIKNRFILVTHNSALTSGLNNNILNNPLLLKWYGQNMNPHKKSEGIPLGIMNSQYEGSDYELCKKYKNCKKDKLLYFNFSYDTNPERKKIAKILKKNNFIENNKTEWKKYIQELSQHKFCISPPGKGVDCHRIWEAIYVGSIPIVKKDKIIYNYFKNLPILWIDDFNKISKDFLNTVDMKTILSKKLKKSRLSYWENKFSI